MRPTVSITRQLLFVGGLVSGGTNLGGLFVSIASQTHRFWPHGNPNWTFWLGWIAWTVDFGNLFGVTYVDWRNWFHPSTLVRVGSHLLFVAGAVVSTWAIWNLGIRESTGLEGHSRNPPYEDYRETVPWFVGRTHWQAPSQEGLAQSNEENQ